MADIELVWDTRSPVTEGCLWDEKNRRLLFADMNACKIMVYGVTDKSKTSWSLPEDVRSFGLCKSGRLVVALPRRLVYYDPKSGNCEAFSEQLPASDYNIFNDGKVGPDGCFWVGTANRDPAAANNPDLRKPTGSLYRVTPDGRVEKKSHGYITSNGLAWSPDGRTMYHTDSSSRYIDAWDFNAGTGAIANRRRIATVTDEIGRPDGAACDTDGFYWSAGVSSGKLNKFSPQGELVQSIDLSNVPAPTMPCFAGDLLFITSLRQGRSEELIRQHPSMGGLFCMPAPAKGAAIAEFADR